jgi:hypothetical protein
MQRDGWRSFDGGRDVIHEYSRHRGFWVREPDRGICNVMNKGVLRAAGKCLVCLKSGDEFDASDALGRLIAEGDDKDIVYGDDA